MGFDFQSFIDCSSGVRVAASGQSAWGEPTFGHPKTLYLATEDLEGAKRSLAASCIARGISKAECRVDIVDTRSINIPQISNAGNMAIVRDTLVAGGYKIFAVDVMAFATAGENMGDTEKVAAALQYVKPLYEQDGISTWLLTHSTKDGKSYFGGVLLLGAVYQAWEVGKEGGQIRLTNIAMRGAPQVEGSLVFEAQSIDLPGELDNRGRKPNAMFPKFLHRDGTGRDIETKAGREIQVKYLLAALRSSAGKHWRAKELAIEAREKGCTIGIKTLQNSVLKCGDGWGIKHPILAPYYHNASEEWRTPPVLPAIPSGYDLPTDDDAPDGKVVPIQRRRRKTA